MHEELTAAFNSSARLWKPHSACICQSVGTSLYQRSRSYYLSGLSFVARKTTVLRLNNSPPMDIRGVRLVLELALSRATTVLRKEMNHAKPRSNDDA